MSGTLALLSALGAAAAQSQRGPQFGTSAASSLQRTTGAAAATATGSTVQSQATDPGEPLRKITTAVNATSSGTLTAASTLGQLTTKSPYTDILKFDQAPLVANVTGERGKLVGGFASAVGAGNKAGNGTSDKLAQAGHQEFLEMNDLILQTNATLSSSFQEAQAFFANKTLDSDTSTLLASYLAIPGQKINPAITTMLADLDLERAAFENRTIALAQSLIATHNQTTGTQLATDISDINTKSDMYNRALSGIDITPLREKTNNLASFTKGLESLPQTVQSIVNGLISYADADLEEIRKNSQQVMSYFKEISTRYPESREAAENVALWTALTFLVLCINYSTTIGRKAYAMAKLCCLDKIGHQYTADEIIKEALNPKLEADIPLWNIYRKFLKKFDSLKKLDCIQEQIEKLEQKKADLKRQKDGIPTTDPALRRPPVPSTETLELQTLTPSPTPHGGKTPLLAGSEPAPPEDPSKRSHASSSAALIQEKGEATPTLPARPPGRAPKPTAPLPAAPANSVDTPQS
jgi:hypothetical protein